MKVKEVVKKTLNLSGIIESVAKWLATGPIGIALGLIGLGGISSALYNLSKKMKEARYNSDINDMNEVSGNTSQTLASNARNNREMLDAILEAQKVEVEDSIPMLSAPEVVKRGEAFTVRYNSKKIPSGTKIFADYKWVIGFTRATGKTRVILNNSGKRTLSIEFGGDKVSRLITVKE